MRTVLVVGSGGREHALAWRLAQSPQVARVIVAPGNPGMPREWERYPITLADGRPAFEALAAFAKGQNVDLVVVGPDNPLADGIVDVLEAHEILAFGPRAQAAQIEASKSFAKDIMSAAEVPTAKYWTVNSEEEGRKLLKSVPFGAHGWVIKADGLAFGKGVRVCTGRDEALSALEELARFSKKWVIEEQLRGEELSWMAFCDGERCALLEPARDYKRLLDQDLGPNTGGMGSFSPVPGISPALAEEVRLRVFLPTLRELKKRGAEYRGVLYAGLMVDFSSQKFWVLEFNARLGDPEAQVLLPRMEGDLYSWCEAVAKGDLTSLPSSVPFKKESAVYVVAAAEGYPDHPKKGNVIEVQESDQGSERNESKVRADLNAVLPTRFYSGVSERSSSISLEENVARHSRLETTGGRVLGALGIGQDLAEARAQAYAHLKRVRFEGMQFRLDIAQVKENETEVEGRAPVGQAPNPLASLRTLEISEQ